MAGAFPELCASPKGRAWLTKIPIPVLAEMFSSPNGAMWLVEILQEVGQARETQPPPAPKTFPACPPVQTNSVPAPLCSSFLFSDAAGGSGSLNPARRGVKTEGFESAGPIERMEMSEIFDSFGRVQSRTDMLKGLRELLQRAKELCEPPPFKPSAREGGAAGGRRRAFGDSMSRGSLTERSRNTEQGSPTKGSGSGSFHEGGERLAAQKLAIEGRSLGALGAGSELKRRRQEGEEKRVGDDVLNKKVRMLEGNQAAGGSPSYVGRKSHSLREAICWGVNGNAMSVVKSEEESGGSNCETENSEDEESVINISSIDRTNNNNNTNSYIANNASNTNTNAAIELGDSLFKRSAAGKQTADPKWALERGSSFTSQWKYGDESGGSMRDNPPPPKEAGTRGEYFRVNSGIAVSDVTVLEGLRRGEEGGKREAEGKGKAREREEEPAGRGRQAMPPIDLELCL